MRLSPSGGRKIENFWRRTDTGNGRRGCRWRRSHGLVERDGIYRRRWSVRSGEVLEGEELERVACVNVG
jgi:hypothetical protein